jgi:hypothetical protein
MNFSNENLLIIIVLISIVIMFLTSDSICKNKEQFTSPIDFTCDAEKCGRNPEICTGDVCLPVTTGGACKWNKCKSRSPKWLGGGCIGGLVCDPIRTNWCGKRSPKTCTPGAAKCC